ncbi:MAG: hypothetical protein GY742_20155 [Hyphomicrobiales bacterium]|nr:hypothetical protein [Hyphomicrobiales bacterium]
MTKLEDRLKHELGDWFEWLPKAWQEKIDDDVALDFDAVDDEAELEDDERIWPQETNPDGPKDAHLFKAFQDLAPSDVKVVIFGNDPYTRISQATGRSFEQGDLSDWKTDLATGRRVSPSIKSIVTAAAALAPGGVGYGLTDVRKLIEEDASAGRRQPVWFCHYELERAINDDAVKLPVPTEIFDYWTRQGVLWLNRTLTYTKWLDENQQDTHRSSHRRMWAPFTKEILITVVEEAKSRPVVFVLWGSSADDLAEDIEKIRKSRNISKRNVRTVSTGHPQWAEGYFRVGNPLLQINYALKSSGKQINWS